MHSLETLKKLNDKAVAEAAKKQPQPQQVPKQ